MAGVGACRCFVGLPLPGAWQEGLARVAQGLSSRLSSRVAWTRPGNWHLTLKFLGGVDAARLPKILAALVGVRFAPLSLAVGRAGAYPPPGRGAPRVLWAGLAHGAEDCAALAAAVERALAPLGFAPEARPFAAHLTLGRVKAVAPGDDWGEVARALAGEAWPVAEVAQGVLWKSTLSSAGPRYDELGRFGGP